MMDNIEFIKTYNYTLDQIFEVFKENNLTSREWAEILKYREGILNFISLYQIIKKSITWYDKSTHVNSFYYKDKQQWIDKNIRVGLFRLIDSGAEQITLQLDNIYVTLSAEQARDFLNQLEVYAGKCFAVTAKHYSDLQQVYKVEDLLNYDYTTGYPDKITLNEN